MTTRGILFGTLMLGALAACGDSLHLDPGVPPASSGGNGGAAAASSSNSSDATSSSSSSTATASSSSSSGQGGGSAGCLSNADCPTPTAVCDVAYGKCVECLVQSDCALHPGTVCSKGACGCPDPADTYCSAKPGDAGYCANLKTATDDCGACGQKCFGACSAGKCADPWRPTAETADTPAARHGHVAVWTGTKMLVWGGISANSAVNTGSVYDPAANTWTPMSVINAPSARQNAVAAWTGSRMLVWGGDNGAVLGDGGSYDPATNTWTTMNVANAPAPRTQHAGAWANGSLLVWGGHDGATFYGDGGIYDQQTDTWSVMNGTNAPQARRGHAAVYAGNKLFVWGGIGLDVNNSETPLASGGLFDPTLNQWTMATNGNNAPSARADYVSAWTGTDVVLWAGADPSPAGTGAKYTPLADAWIALNDPQPSPRTATVGVWVKSAARFFAWGGQDGNGALDDGGSYNPVTNAWKPLPKAPAARSFHSAVAADGLVIVWGGMGSGGDLSSGAILDTSMLP